LSSQRSDAEVVEERLEGEAAALGAFEATIQQDMPVDLETMLRVQHAAIKGAREHLSRLQFACEA
jgi:hypothetical protein